MCLGVPVKDLFDYFGHDGSKVISDDPVPFCYRSFHDREMADYCLSLGKSLTCLDRTLQYYNLDHSQIHEYEYLEGPKRLYDTIISNVCVLGGLFPRLHAVACDGELVYDPKGSIFPLEDFIRAYHFDSIERVFVVI